MGNMKRRNSAIVAAGFLATLAPTPPSSAIAATVRAAPSSTLHRTIVVTATGRTLYHRIGETGHHFLCGTVCSRVWPALTVPSPSTSLVRGPGVTGALGRVRRPDGRWQVTLRGMPLYRFSGDHGAGDIHGQGDLGIWFALSASTATAPSPAPGPYAY